MECRLSMRRMRGDRGFGAEARGQWNQVFAYPGERRTQRTCTVVPSYFASSSIQREGPPAPRHHDAEPALSLAMGGRCYPVIVRQQAEAAMLTPEEERWPRKFFAARNSCSPSHGVFPSRLTEPQNPFNFASKQPIASRSPSAFVYLLASGY